jgi:co-chaperonin GroES (HSP10)
MKAVNYYVIVEKIKEGPKKVSGLILTDETDTDNRYKKAIIQSVGNLVKIVSKGDTVFYDKHAGHDISYNDKIYQVITVNDIVLVE